MIRLPLRISPTAVLAVSLLLASSPTWAQPLRHGPCAKDLQSLCSDVPGGPAALMRCLRDHQAELSDACREDLEERNTRQQARQEKIQSACQTDIEQLCSELEPGRPTNRCLRQNYDKLSESCQEAMPMRRRPSAEQTEARRARMQALRERIQAECAADIERFCASLEPSRPVGFCLRQHYQELSDSCQKAMQVGGGRGPQ